jgi:hypothetical protein
VEAKVQTGILPSRVRWLIAGACAVTIAIAYEGMHSMWDVVEFATQRSQFMYGTTLALGIAAALACAYLPRFTVSRLVRVAVLLPVIHLIAIFVAAQLWSLLQGDLRTFLREWDLPGATRGLALPSLIYLGAAFAVVIATAIIIKRRHGEWAHAAVMLTLAFLLLLGFWLPLLSNWSVTAYEPRWSHGYRGHGHEWEDLKILGITLDRFVYTRRLLNPELFAIAAIVPPALLSVGFTTIAFRAPRLLARARRVVAGLVIASVPMAIFCALSLLDDGWIVYLEASALLLFALLLAIGALITLTGATWLRSYRAHRHLRTLPTQTAKIAADEDGPIAQLEITSWLRGPHLSVRSFVLETPQGDVPVRGATLLTPIPAATTQLEVGHHSDVLAAGDHVIVAGRDVASDGPFRAIDAPEVEVVAAPGARRYRFSDVALVVWRPAVAYLAIVVAIALPYLSIFLT